jgi:hypothetical protein
MNWFKLLAINEGKEDWMLEELKKGNLRYGWSPRGSNLRVLDTHNWEELDKIILKAPDWEATGSVIYRRGAFLINRITSGDKIVVQFFYSSDEYYLFEVTDGYVYSNPEYDEFNHILKGKLINEKPLLKYSQILSNILRHDLSKRGRYYQIYSTDSCQELERIIKNEAWNATVDKKFMETEYDRMNEDIITNTIDRIHIRWPSKQFECFIINLLKKIDGIEIKTDRDSYQGWDLTISIRDKLTGELLYDDVPVQCKNYGGDVNSEKPIEDLERCVKNSNKSVSIFYLFIIGNLTEFFYKKLNESEIRMKNEYKRDISYKVVDQIQIARLYLKHYNYIDN